MIVSITTPKVTIIIYFTTCHQCSTCNVKILKDDGNVILPPTAWQLQYLCYMALLCSLYVNIMLAISLSLMKRFINYI